MTIERRLGQDIFVDTRFRIRDETTGFKAIFELSQLSEDRTFTLPDDSGTIALRSWVTTGFVAKSLFDADTFLYASTDNTPVATSPAGVLAALSEHAAGQFKWNNQTLTDIRNLFATNVNTSVNVTAAGKVLIGTDALLSDTFELEIDPGDAFIGGTLTIVGPATSAAVNVLTVTAGAGFDSEEDGSGMVFTSGAGGPGPGDADSGDLEFTIGETTDSGSYGNILLAKNGGFVGIGKTPTTNFDLLGNSLVTLTGISDDRVVVDGETTKITLGGTASLQMGYSFTNTYDGVLGSGATAIGYQFRNTMEGSRSGTGFKFTSRGINLNNNWGLAGGIAGEGDLIITSRSRVTEHLGIELASVLRNSATIDNQGTGSPEFKIKGGQFTASIDGATITNSGSGTLIFEVIGGTFTAGSIGAPTLNGTPTINFVGGDSIAEMPAAFSSLGTSIGHRFKASGGDTNIALQVLAISNAGLLNVGLNIGDIGGGATNYAIQTGNGDVSFGDRTILEAGALYLKERATPFALAGYGAIYTKSDNNLYFQDEDGTEHTVSLL